MYAKKRMLVAHAPGQVPSGDAAYDARMIYIPLLHLQHHASVSLTEVIRIFALLEHTLE